MREGIDGIDAANRFLAERFLARPERPLRRPGRAAGQRLRRGRQRHPARSSASRSCAGSETTTQWCFTATGCKSRPGRRPHFVKAQVKVRRYLDGTFAVFHGPRQISRYSATGELQDETSSPGVNRFDAEPACGFDGRHPRVAHNLKWTPILGPLA